MFQDPTNGLSVTVLRRAMEKLGIDSDKYRRQIAREFGLDPKYVPEATLAHMISVLNPHGSNRVEQFIMRHVRTYFIKGPDVFLEDGGRETYLQVSRELDPEFPIVPQSQHTTSGHSIPERYLG